MGEHTNYWVTEGVRNVGEETIVEIVDAAIQLQAAMYSNEETGPLLFRLRKPLEGIFGHDLDLMGD